MKKQKILFLDHTPFVGGAQLSLIQHLEYLDKNQFNFFIGCSAEAQKIGLIEEYKKRGFKYKILAFGRLKSFNPLVVIRLVKSVLAWRKFILKEKIDLVFGNTIRADIVGSLAILGTKAKIIWFIQDYTFPPFLFKLFQKIPAKIFYVSHSVLTHYGQKINQKNKVIHIWRDFFKKTNFNNQEILEQKKEWKAKGAETLVGFIGRLVEWKGPQILIEAINILQNQGIKNIKAIIIGSGKSQEGNNEDELKKLVQKYNLKNNVIFTGHLNKVPLAFQCLDIFCLTSCEKEPFSSVVVESMMAKVSVIGTNIGGTPEIVEDKKTGLLVEPNNAKDLSQAIKMLIKNKEIKEEMVQNAYEHVIRHNTTENATRRLEKIYLATLA